MANRRGRAAWIAVAGGLAASFVALIGTTLMIQRPTRVGATGPAVDDADIAVASGATLRIVARGCQGQVTGSAFAVAVPGRDQPVLVTNSHVVTDAPTAKLDVPIRATTTPVLASSDTVDLAALSPVGSIALELSPDVPERGDAIAVVGHPGGGGIEVLDTTVHLVTDGAAWGQDARVVLFDAPVIPGFSGGPLIGADGTVVGIVTGYGESTGLGVAVLGVDVRQWLEQNLAVAPEFPAQGLALCDD